MNLKKNLLVLQRTWKGCTRCDLSQTRKPGQDIFFGYGLGQKYLIVGTAPTESDEHLSSMFSGGKDGVLLMETFAKAGIDPKDCYYTYAVSCRPKVIIPETEGQKSRIEGRAPSREELSACRPRLYEILYQVDPRIIITLGEGAARTMIRGKLPKFASILGRQFPCVLPSATPEDHLEGKVSGKSRYHDITYPVMVGPDLAAIQINAGRTNEHGPLSILQKTLTRARTYVEFVLNNEEKTLQSMGE